MLTEKLIEMQPPDAAGVEFNESAPNSALGNYPHFTTYKYKSKLKLAMIPATRTADVPNSVI